MSSCFQQVMVTQLLQRTKWRVNPPRTVSPGLQKAATTICDLLQQAQKTSNQQRIQAAQMVHHDCGEQQNRAEVLRCTTCLGNGALLQLGKLGPEWLIVSLTDLRQGLSPPPCCTQSLPAPVLTGQQALSSNQYDHQCIRNKPQSHIIRPQPRLNLSLQ